MPTNEICVAIYYCYTLHFKSLKMKSKHSSVSIDWFILSWVYQVVTKVLWWTWIFKYCGLVCKPQVVFYFQPYNNRTQSYWELLDSHKRYSLHGFEFLHFFCRLVRRKYRSLQLFTILLYSTCLFISVSQWHLCCIRMQPPGAALWAWGHSSRSPSEHKLQLVSWWPGCCLETWENSSCSLCSVTVLAEGLIKNWDTAKVDFVALST